MIVIDFFFRRKLVFFLVLFLGAGIIFLGISRLKVDESVFSALPRGKSFSQLNSFIKNNNISSPVIFTLEAGVNEIPSDLAESVRLFADSLKTASNQLLSEIVVSMPDIEEQSYSYFYHHFPWFIDSAYYKTIDCKINPDSIRAALHSSYYQLISPGSAFLKNYILNDPLSLSGNFFKSLNKYKEGQNVVVDGDLMFSKDKKKILVTARLSYNSDNSRNNIELHNLLVEFQRNWNSIHLSRKMDYFGTFEIAAENAMQVKKDTLITVALSVLAIFFILFFYYKKRAIPFYFFLPAVAGGAFALGVTGFLKQEISAISLATGAVLLGIIVDYSFHFFTHLKHSRSLSITIKEIAAPLLTGSFTTITALAALCFTNSVILQDFGLLAALSLSGAIIFTLTCLPVLLKLFAFDYKNIPDEPIVFKKPLFSPRSRKIFLWIIIIVTPVLLYTSKDVQFDGNLEDLSFHSEKLMNKEEEIFGIDPASEKKIYLFATHRNADSAIAANFNLYRKLTGLADRGEIKSFVSTGQLLIPDAVKKEREMQWIDYWKKNENGTIKILKAASDSIGFSSGAFNGFEGWIKGKSSTDIVEDSLLRLLGLKNLVDAGAEKSTIISMVVVNNENREKVKAELENTEGIQIFDRAETASLLLESVKDDFNNILWISVSIVFLALLVIYGRIELVLLAFLPMTLSWIWILGIAGIAGIKFNFVNVVISTFIFGLGDDYSIFVTDGLLNKYKYKRNSLSSYTPAIILSAVTTMIGIGVLFFAKHPAIHSIAAISVLGISSILFFSLLFQPVLFDFFIQNRIEKKKSPIPISELIISVIAFSHFAIGCILFYSVAFAVILLPVSRKIKAKLLNSMISPFARSVIYIGFHVRKRIFMKENLDIEKPSVIISNHSSFLDILLIIMLNPRIILMVKDWVYHSPLFGFFVRYSGYIFSENGTEKNIRKIKERMADGYSIMIFPEGTRSADGKIGRFHKGAFYLAQELRCDITPILIHGACYTLPKNEFIVKTGEMNIKILPRIKHDDPEWGNTYSERAKSISRYFKSEHSKFTEERETSLYLLQRVLKNYIFKGPVLEWYIRIKWKIEHKNFQLYHQLIENRCYILDIGCGYGYLSLYLHYKNENRKIAGVDYDEEKIHIADNCFDKNENVNFVFSDILNFSMKNQDVIFLNDVLHYMPLENQQLVLERCASSLNENGMIFIRDGITDLAKRHQNTALSEFLSTKIFRFNKKENDFNFISAKFIKTFAEKNKLSVEIIEHSKTTSNVLFILRKQ